MRLGLLTLVSLLLLSCSPAVKKTTSLLRPATPAPEPEDQPGEAIEFDRLKRVLGSGEIPVERYFTAIDHINRMPVYSSARSQFVTSSKTAPARDATLGDWTELGPGNIGGRVSSLLIRPDDPKVMYAGAVAGGIFKTTDGGASWTPTADQLPNIAVNALAMDPKDPNVIYAGTGQCCAASGVRGAGILKTTDGGDIWIRLRLTTSQLFYYVNKIAVSPNDSRRVYAATWAGVMVSVDGGETWSLTLNRTGPKLGCQDLAIRTDQPTDYLFAACGIDNDQAVIFRNVDAAGSGKWSEVYTEQYMSRTVLALAPSNQGVIYALASSSETGPYHNGLLAVFRSTKNGDPDSWEARVSNTDPVRLNSALLANPLSFFADECRGGTSNGNNQGFHAIAIAVDPLDPERVWAGGIDLFRSDDGGANWGMASQWWDEAVPQYSHADHKALVFHPGFDGVSNQILFDTNDGGVFRTQNARDATGAGAKAACTPSTSKVTWTSLNHNFGATQFYHGQVYPGGQIYLAGAQDNGTSRGAEATGADGWQRVSGGDGGYVAIDPQDPNRIYFETTELSLRRSVNGGAISTSAVSGITEPNNNFLFITPFLLDPNDASRLWMGGKTIWRSSDGAQRWTAASARIAGGSVSALAIAPGKPERALVGSSTGYIHRTDNALAADSNTDWPFVLPRRGYVSSLAFDPANPDIAYATYSTFDSGLDAGHVFKSVDGGATWNLLDGQRGASIPDVPVECILADPANSSVLYLGTDLGVFVSGDGGASWAKEDTRFPNTMVESLAIDRNGGASTLFAFTRGRGVWRVRLGGQTPSCLYSLDPPEISLPAFGGSASIKVNTQDGCVWSAASGSGWARLSSPAGGKGNGAVELTASLNSGVARLSGAIAIADQKLPVSVAGAETPSGNDEIATSAIVAQLPYVARLDTTGASANGADPVHSCTQSRDGKTVWFQLTARSSGTLTALSAGFAANVGTVLTAYSFDGRIGPELACARQAAGASQIKFSVTAGRSYLIELSAPSTSSGGDILLELF